MDKQISSRLRTTFLVHMIVSGILGAALWLVPGRTLLLLGCVEDFVLLPESDLSVPGTTFVDALITRLLGAALLALAFSSFQGWRAGQWGQVSRVVQLEAVFCMLGTLAFLATLILREHATPPLFWVLLVTLLAFTGAWGLALRNGD
jgi:uncharacterized membrane protein